MGDKYFFSFKVRTWGGGYGSVDLIEDNYSRALEKLNQILGDEGQKAFDVRTLYLERIFVNPDKKNEDGENA